MFLSANLREEGFNFHLHLKFQKSVENFVSQDNNHENITEEDKNKLNDLLKSLSKN